MAKIRVHEKALAHLSRGLYRSPASAIRELVSNAWDANATEIRIGTNYPNFLEVRVEDNGDGFTKDEFDKLMGGGIGTSAKRPQREPLAHNRPLIGRLGIGMLGVAQICGGFTIISCPRVGSGFRARVTLYDLLKERLDDNDEMLVKTQEVDVGEYQFETFDSQALRHGTVLVADDVHPTFARSFQQSVRFEHYREPPLDWSKALDIVSKVRSLQELGDYWRLLWELSAACPVPYLHENALPDQLVAEEQRKLLSYNFKVLVDGIQLFKPVFLRDNPGGYTTYKIAPQTNKVYGRDLTFHGYIVVQEGVQLRPDELRGILLRVKNVAVGYYDPSMLDYRINEGPRSRWLTGEILIEDGLEDALNIDRDSFNRFHPEFRAVQECVHRTLHEKVFPAVYRQIDVRSQTRARQKQETQTKRLKDVIANTVEVPVVIQDQTGATTGELPHATVKRTKTELAVTLPALASIETKSANRQLAGAVLALFELAMKETSQEKQRKVFTRLLLELLARW